MLEQAWVKRVLGPLAVAETSPDFSGCRLFEAAFVGKKKLLGEVLRVRGREVDIQLFEEASGLAAGDPVRFAGGPLEADLGPGLLGQILNAAGNPLTDALEFSIPEKKENYRLERGFRNPEAVSAGAGAAWRFRPAIREGDAAASGAIVGTTDEDHFLYRVLVPPHVKPGRVAWIAPEGDYGAWDCICRLSGGEEFSMARRAALRVPRFAGRHLPPSEPLSTGWRALDALFPLAAGGTALLSGGIGAGKTAMLRSTARCVAADVVVYVVCGERGTDAAEAAEELLEASGGEKKPPARAILIVSSSDMPPAGRDLSVCLGMTLAEHYRDMGYAAAVMVDSASGWTDALRGIEACLAEASQKEAGETRFPAYLGSRVSACLGRAGAAETGTASRGSVTLLTTAASEIEGGLENAGGLEGDPAFHILRSGAYWRLDKNLARACRFALDWERSRSPYGDAPGAEDDWGTLLEYLKSSGAPVSSRGALAEWDEFHAETVRAVYLEQESADRNGARADLIRFLRALDRAAQRALASGRSREEVAALVSRPELLVLRDLPERDFRERARKWLEDFESKLPAEGPAEAGP
jgi:V/A-type H+-transporting ATPase subunit A